MRTIKFRGKRITFYTSAHRDTRRVCLTGGRKHAACEVVIRKANKGMHEIEIKTETANADYFRTSLGG